MSGDLEDFLRRAAQRRQAKSAQEQQQQPAPRPRPQYTNRRTERVVRGAPHEENLHDEVLSAEIVEDDTVSIASRLSRLEESKRAAARAEAEAADRLRKVTATRSKSSAAAVALSGNAAQDLIAMLRHPGGIRQAILLREILERPEHRW